MGATFRTMQKRMMPRTGAHTIKITASRGFIQKDNPTPITSMMGLRTKGRNPPLMAFCSTVTSVVIRVTKEAASKWSRLAKE